MYVIKKLTGGGFAVKYTHPNLIYISWYRDKKPTKQYPTEIRSTYINTLQPQRLQHQSRTLQQPQLTIQRQQQQQREQQPQQPQQRQQRQQQERQQQQRQEQDPILLESQLDCCVIL